MELRLSSEIKASKVLPVISRAAMAVLAAIVLIMVCIECRPFRAAAEPPTVSHTDLRNGAVILVKNALIAVNQANLTGNYTVLRDLASPGFRERNSAADLAKIFQNLREQKIDLSPIVLLDPILNRPKQTDEGLLLLKGYFPSEPVRVNFEMLFVKAGSGGWMIQGVSIGTAKVETVAANEARETKPQSPPNQDTRASLVIPASTDTPESEAAAPRPKSAPTTAPSTVIRRSKP